MQDAIAIDCSTEGRCSSSNFTPRSWLKIYLRYIQLLRKAAGFASSNLVGTVGCLEKASTDTPSKTALIYANYNLHVALLQVGVRWRNPTKPRRAISSSASCCFGKTFLAFCMHKPFTFVGRVQWSCYNLRSHSRGRRPRGRTECQSGVVHQARRPEQSTG